MECTVFQEVDYEHVDGLIDSTSAIHNLELFRFRTL